MLAIVKNILKYTEVIKLFHRDKDDNNGDSTQMKKNKRAPNFLKDIGSYNLLQIRFVSLNVVTSSYRRRT